MRQKKLKVEYALFTYVNQYGTCLTLHVSYTCTNTILESWRRESVGTPSSHAKHRFVDLLSPEIIIIGVPVGYARFSSRLTIGRTSRESTRHRRHQFLFSEVKTTARNVHFRCPTCVYTDNGFCIKINIEKVLICLQGSRWKLSGKSPIPLFPWHIYYWVWRVTQSEYFMIWEKATRINTILHRKPQSKNLNKNVCLILKETCVFPLYSAKTHCPWISYARRKAVRFLLNLLKVPAVYS